MKRELRFFIFWSLAFILATVFVGNSLSYHFDNDLYPSQKVSFTKNIENQSPPLSTDHDEDPCVQGFSHLGHCALIVAPEVPILLAAMDAVVLYSFQEKSLWDRVLDGPFQPPKFA